MLLLSFTKRKLFSARVELKQFWQSRHTLFLE